MNASANNPALVSIVIPAYNCATTIAATIESCLAQTYENVEIIVVNDGSTDETAEVLRSFGAKIRVVNKANGGLASARNAGTRVAAGEFIAWMDSDDLMAPDRIILQSGVLASDSTVQLTSSDFSAFVNDDADFEASHMSSYYSALGPLGGLANIYPQESETTEFGRDVIVRKGQVFLSLLSGNFVHPPTVMIRRSVFDRIGPFDEAMRANSDYDFILRAARGGYFAYIDTPLLRYRRSNTQMSRTAIDKIQLETIAILEKVQRDYPLVYLSQEQLFRRRFAELHIDAAQLLGPIDRLRALRLLLRGVRHELLFGAASFAVTRIFVPRFVVRAAKAAWRSVALRANCFALGWPEYLDYLFLLPP